MLLHLFAYGTLQDLRLLRRLVGTVPDTAPAVLHGYARYTVAGADYPGIVTQPGTKTPGTLFRSLPESAWTTLDAYESDLYDRLSVTVELSDGSACVAQAYVIPPEKRHVLSDAPWDPNHYLPLPNEPG